MNKGRIDAAAALHRGKERRGVMPLIKARRTVKVAARRDEHVDLSALHAGP